MNEPLKAIKTETLAAAISDVDELEAGLSEIFTKYGGMNIRSIIAIFHRYHCQVEINDGLFLEGDMCYADSAQCMWDGDPKKIEHIRLGNFKHLSYIYISPKVGGVNHYIDRFDIGYEDDAEWVEEVSLYNLKLELEIRNRVILPSVVEQATKMFTDLQIFISQNELSLCYDEDDCNLFIGPKDLLWNVHSDPGEKGSNRDPELRKYATRELMEKFAKQGHLAHECITHLHVSDSDETFKSCDLTYSV
jgi:hypothetical protein